MMKSQRHVRGSAYRKNGLPKLETFSGSSFHALQVDHCFRLMLNNGG